MLKLYSDKMSGNCFKARLIMHLMGQTFETIETNVVEAETQRAEFLALNPVGKVPTLVFDDGQMLSESNAILLYFAKDTKYMPEDAFDQAKVFQWLFWEQYSHETAIAVARYSILYMKNTVESDPRLPALWEKGNAALKIMDDHLVSQDFFASCMFTVADIALYAYTHVAEDGKFNLSDYPNVQKWLKRVESQDDFQPMEAI